MNISEGIGGRRWLEWELSQQHDPANSLSANFMMGTMIRLQLISVSNSGNFKTITDNSGASGGNRYLINIWVISKNRIAEILKDMRGS